MVHAPLTWEAFKPSCGDGLVECCYALTTKTPISYFHDLSLDLFLSGLVWLQIYYAEVQSSMIDGYLAFQKVRYLF